MSEHIEYIEYDNGIHEFIFLNTNREAVNDYVNQLEALIKAMIEDDSATMLRFMVNLTETRDLPAFSYITNQGRRMLQGFLKDRGKFHLRGAFLAKQNKMMVLSLTESFIKLIPVDINVKVFEENSRDEAINWLLADE